MRSERHALVYKYNALIKTFLEKYQISFKNKSVALAVSGGSDSVFLATMLLQAKKSLMDFSRVRIVHINHHWREESFEDEKFVKDLGAKYLIPVDVYHVYPEKTGESAELQARNQRKEIFKQYEVVLTGHTSDDLFETILWKTLQGKNPENGILVSYENEVRPLLSFKKEEMQSVLNKIGVSWVEDRTNHDGVLLRSKMRKNLMKVLKEDFPFSQDTVVKKALEGQIKSDTK